MNSMSQALADHLRGRPLNVLGQALGLSPQKASTAITAGLPLVIGALARNARRPGGARNLFAALERDHKGQDPQSVLVSALDGGQAGDRILRHVFGAREPVAAQALATASGMAPDHAQRLLRLLAPVAMAFVAQQVFERRQRAPGSTPAKPADEDALRRRLEREQQQLDQEGGVGSRLLQAVLDRNHDGRVDFSDLLTGGEARGMPPRVARQAPPSPWIRRDGL